MSAGTYISDPTRRTIPIRRSLRLAACTLCLLCEFPSDPVAYAQESAIRPAGEHDKPALAWLHRHLSTHVATARRSGKLTAAQIAQLDLLDANWLTEQLNSNPVLGIAPNYLRRADIPTISPKLDDAIMSILNSEQSRVFRDAVAKSRAFRAETLADVALVNIERKIYIDEPRRKRLRDKLIAWCMKNDLQASYYLANPTRLPKLPTADIAEILDETQMKKLGKFTLFSFQATLYETSMLVHAEPILFREVADRNRLREQKND